MWCNHNQDRISSGRSSESHTLTHCRIEQKNAAKVVVVLSVEALNAYFPDH